MTKTNTKTLYYFFTAFFVLLLLIMPRGTTVDDIAVKPNQRGEVVLSLNPDTGTAGTILDKLPSFTRLQMFKDDYGVVAFYTYRLSFNLKAVPQLKQFQFKTELDLPGEITSVEGGTKEDGKAVFLINSGQTNNMAALSREIRWIWIILLAAAMTGTGFFYVQYRYLKRLT